MASPTFFIDTSILIAHIRQKTNALTPYDRALLLYGVPAVSEISVYEIELGGRRSNRVNEFESRFKYLQTMNVDRAVALYAAEIHADLLKKNLAIGLPDTLITATALVHQLPLLTLNSRHFSRVSGLKLLQVP